MNIYSAVNGPRTEDLSDAEVVDRAIAANVAFAREAALTGDADGERIHHDAIDRLLDTREQATANRTARKHG